MDSIQLSLRYIAIKTSNLDEMLSFYTNQLGLHPLSFENEVIYLGSKEEKMPLLMLVDEPWEENEHHHLNHFAFQLPTEESLKTLYRQLKQQGVMNEPLIKKGHITHFFITDPDQNEIELYYCHEGQLDEALNGEEKMIESYGEVDEQHMNKTLGHVHLSVQEIEDTLSFYRDILQLDLVSHQNQYHLVNKDNGELMLSIDEAEVSPQSSIDFIAFQVDTMDELLLLKERLESFDYEFYFNRGKQIIQLWDANRISYWIQAVNA